MNGNLLLTLLLAGLTLGAAHSLFGWNPFTAEAWTEDVWGGVQTAAGEAGKALGQAQQFVSDSASSAYSWFTQNTGLDPLAWAKQTYDKAAAPLLNPVYDKVVKPAVTFVQQEIIAPVLDKISAGKAKEVAAKLREVATMIKNVPSDIEKQIGDIKTMPDQLQQGIADLQVTIAQILLSQKDIAAQRLEVVNQNLKSKGLAELAQLETTLLQAFDELLGGLQLLATCQPLSNEAADSIKKMIATIEACKTPACTEQKNAAYASLEGSIKESCRAGILYDYGAALYQAKADAQTGANTILNNIKKLNSTINEPTMGYPSLTGRIEGIASILDGG